MIPPPSSLSRCGRALLLFLFLAEALAGQAPRKLRVGCDRDYPPYEYVDAAGHPAGFNIDLLRAVAELNNIELELHAGPWADVRAAFERGELDLLSGMFISPERAKRIDFSVPHSIVTYAVFVRKGTPEPRSEAELAGRRILAHQGDIAWDRLRARGLDVRGTSSPEEALKALSEGKADCAVLCRATGLFLLHGGRFPNLKRSSAPFLPQKYCFAVPKGQPELLASLNEGLFVLKESGRFSEISARHFDALESRELPFRTVLKRASVVLLPGLALLAAALAWTWTLRRLVGQRTRALAAELHERTRAEGALRESEARFRAFVDHTTDNLFWLRVEAGPAFVIEGLNPAQARALGHTPEALLGQPVEAALPPDLGEAVVARYRECLALGRPTLYKERAHLHDGLHTFETLLVPVRGDDGRIHRLVGTARDITVVEKAEEDLRQAQKLESLGVLAGGIAHDFNNLLTAILGNLNLAQAKLGPASPAEGHLASAEETVLKASELTRQMLAYSGRGRTLIRPLDLSSLVQELARLLEVSISKRAILRLDLGKELPAVAADAAQLQQLVMNLVTNASDALSDRDGIIRIATWAEHPSEATRKAMAFPPVHDGLQVVLEVSDTGVGIAPEHLARIFDPFFTTKEKGRGLGLSAMLGIIRGHEGGLHLESRQGEGTTFRIYLPASAEQAERPAPPPAQAAPQAKRAVLLVDDDPMVRKSSLGVLEALGCTVVPAGDGVEALEAYRTRAGAFDLVLLDLSMPRMDGRETLAALRREAPELPVLLCSGYSEQDLGEELAGDPKVAFLQKPFRLAELRRAMGQLLGEALRA